MVNTIEAVHTMIPIISRKRNRLENAPDSEWPSGIIYRWQRFRKVLLQPAMSQSANAFSSTDEIPKAPDTTLPAIHIKPGYKPVRKSCTGPSVSLRELWSFTSEPLKEEIDEHRIALLVGQMLQICPARGNRWCPGQTVSC